MSDRAGSGDAGRHGRPAVATEVRRAAVAVAMGVILGILVATSSRREP